MATMDEGASAAVRASGNTTGATALERRKPSALAFWQNRAHQNSDASLSNQGSTETPAATNAPTSVPPSSSPSLHATAKEMASLRISGRTPSTSSSSTVRPRQSSSVSVRAAAARFEGAQPQVDSVVAPSVRINEAHQGGELAVALSDEVQRTDLLEKLASRSTGARRGADAGDDNDGGGIIGHRDGATRPTEGLGLAIHSLEDFSLPSLTSSVASASSSARSSRISEGSSGTGTAALDMGLTTGPSATSSSDSAGASPELDSSAHMRSPQGTAAASGNTSSMSDARAASPSQHRSDASTSSMRSFIMARNEADESMPSSAAAAARSARKNSASASSKHHRRGSHEVRLERELRRRSLDAADRPWATLDSASMARRRDAASLLDEQDADDGHESEESGDDEDKDDEDGTESNLGSAGARRASSTTEAARDAARSRRRRKLLLQVKKRQQNRRSQRASSSTDLDPSSPAADGTLPALTSQEGDADTTPRLSKSARRISIGHKSSAGRPSSATASSSSHLDVPRGGGDAGSDAGIDASSPSSVDTFFDASTGAPPKPSVRDTQSGNGSSFIAMGDDDESASPTSSPEVARRRLRGTSYDSWLDISPRPMDTASSATLRQDSQRANDDVEGAHKDAVLTRQSSRHRSIAGSSACSQGSATPPESSSLRSLADAHVTTGDSQSTRGTLADPSLPASPNSSFFPMSTPVQPSSRSFFTSSSKEARRGALPPARPSPTAPLPAPPTSVASVVPRIGSVPSHRGRHRSQSLTQAGGMSVDGSTGGEGMVRSQSSTANLPSLRSVQPVISPHVMMRAGSSSTSASRRASRIGPLPPTAEESSVPSDSLSLHDGSPPRTRPRGATLGSQPLNASPLGALVAAALVSDPPVSPTSASTHRSTRPRSMLSQEIGLGPDSDGEFDGTKSGELLPDLGSSRAASIVSVSAAGGPSGSSFGEVPTTPVSVEGDMSKSQQLRRSVAALVFGDTQTTDSDMYSGSSSTGSGAAGSSRPAGGGGESSYGGSASAGGGGANGDANGGATGNGRNGGGGNRSRSGSNASLLQQVQNPPRSQASFVIAVVGHRGAGKSTVIKKGLRQFGLSKPQVLSDKVASHSTICIVDHEQRTIEVLEIDASVLLNGPGRRFVWPKFLPRFDAVILCYDAASITSFRGMSELLENFSIAQLCTVMLACKSEIYPKAVDPYYASDMAGVFNVGLAECSVQSEEGKKRMRDCFSYLVKEVAKARAGRRMPPLPASDLRREAELPPMTSSSRHHHDEEDEGAATGIEEELSARDRRGASRSVDSSNRAAATGSTADSRFSPTLESSAGGRSLSATSAGYASQQSLIRTSSRKMSDATTASADAPSSTGSLGDYENGVSASGYLGSTPHGAHGGHSHTHHHHAQQQQHPQAQHQHHRPALGLQSAKIGGYVSIDELWEKLFFAAVSGNDERFLLMFMVFYRGFARPVELLRQLTRRFDTLAASEESDGPMIRFSLMRLTTMLGDWMQDYPGDLSGHDVYPDLCAFFDKIMRHPATMHIASPLVQTLDMVQFAPDPDAAWSRNQDNAKPRSIAADVPPVMPAPLSDATTSDDKLDRPTESVDSTGEQHRNRAWSDSSSAGAPANASNSALHLQTPQGQHQSQVPSRNRARSASDVTSSSDGQRGASQAQSQGQQSQASASSTTAGTSSAGGKSQGSLFVTSSTAPPTSISRSLPVDVKLALRAASTSLLETDDEALAAELTRLEWAYFSAIRPRDLLRHILVSRDIRDPQGPVARSIAHFNYISYWVCSMVLVQPKTKQRARLLEKFMNLASLLRADNNYNSLHAVLAGLGNASIHRLKNTRDLVGGKPIQKTYQSLSRLMGSDRSFSAYRLALDNSSGRTIPYLGVHLQDILSISDGNPSKRGMDGMIHWRKFCLMDDAVMAVIRCQQSEGPTPHDSRIEKLIVGLPVMDEDALYLRSLHVEPRQSQGGPTLVASSKIKEFFNAN